MTRIGAFGIGGTYVSVGLVDSETGRVDNFERRELAPFGSYDRCIDDFIKRVIPKGSPMGGCVAGAMNEQTLVGDHLANSPFCGSYDFGKHFGDYQNPTLVGDVRGEGQAATRWIEQYQGILLAMATFSSGYGVDLIQNGLPVLPNAIEVGHGMDLLLPPEFGGYNGMECGCESRRGEHKNHLEAYVSAVASANMARRALLDFDVAAFPSDHPLILQSLEAYNTDSKNDRVESWIMASTPKKREILAYLTGEMVYSTLQANPTQQPQADIRSVQEYAIAQAFRDISSHFHPGTILVKGSLAEDPWNWEHLFKPAIQLARDDGLANFNDDLSIERLQNPQISVMGGAADWIRKNQ